MIDSLPNLRDSLIIAGVALVSYFALVALAQVLRRARGLRFGWTYHGFALLAGLVAGIHFSGWQSPHRGTALQQISAIALLLAAFPLARIVNRVAWFRGASVHPGKSVHVPRVLPDATALAVILMTVLVVLQFIYKVQVPGLLAGSGVIAIILGLAMQDLLGNLIAGIGLHFDKSFTPGDWLQIEGTHAKVIELSWRTTRLITNDDVMIDVPNSNIVKQAILNFEKPTRKHAVKPLIGLHYDVPPAQAQRVLQEAAASVPGVCSDPAPVVYLKEFADSAIIYEINVWIEDHGLMDPVMSEVRVHCWYAAKRAGFEIPYPQLTLHRAAAQASGDSLHTTALQALRTNPVFNFLDDKQAGELLAAGKSKLFAAAEQLVRQGEEGASMFLLVKGHVDVSIAREGQYVTVATLNAGDCLGEMCVLTGEKRSATVTARDEVAAIEITKDALAQLLVAHPALLNGLTDVLVKRQLTNEKLAIGTASTARIDSTRTSVLRRLRVFFQLGS